MAHSYLYVTNSLDSAVARARHHLACMGAAITVGDFVVATNARFDSENAEKAALSVKAARGVIREAYIAPTGDTKAILIPDSDAMLHSAQNALLKVLEEPPEGVVFFLVATDSKLLLPTIKSRVEMVFLVNEVREADGELEARVGGLVRSMGTAAEKYRAMTAIMEMKDDRVEILDILGKIFSLQNASGDDIMKSARMQEKISLARRQIASNCNWNGVVWGMLS